MRHRHPSSTCVGAPGGADLSTARTSRTVAPHPHLPTDGPHSLPSPGILPPRKPLSMIWNHSCRGKSQKHSLGFSNLLAKNTLLLKSSCSFLQSQSRAKICKHPSGQSEKDRLVGTCSCRSARPALWHSEPGRTESVVRIQDPLQAALSREPGPLITEGSGRRLPRCSHNTDLTSNQPGSHCPAHAQAFRRRWHCRAQDRRPAHLRGSRGQPPLPPPCLPPAFPPAPSPTAGQHSFQLQRLLEPSTSSPSTEHITWNQVQTQ